MLISLFLGSQLAIQWHAVAEISAKDERVSPFVALGQRYEYALSDIPADQYIGSRWVLFGSPLRLEFEGLKPDAQYRIKAKFLSDSDQRKMVVAYWTGTLGEIALPKANECRWSCNLPQAAYSKGNLEIEFKPITGPNAVFSEFVLESTDPAKPVAPPTLEDKLKAIKTEVPTFAPVPTAVAGVRQNVLGLNGEWTFALQNQETKKVKVPGELRLQGIQIPASGEGAYKRQFEVPQDWKCKTVRIRFDALFGDAAVFVNGTKVAEHDQTFVPLEVDITKVIRLGKNAIEVRIKGRSTADVLASASQYAAHPLFGILRKVRVFCLPDVYFEDLAVEGSYDPATRLGEAKFLSKVHGRPKDISVQWRANISHANSGFHRTRHLDSWLDFGDLVNKPTPWTPENPYLYNYEITLLNKGKPVVKYAQKHGFRSIKVEGNRLLVNGVPVKLKGVCRHEADLNTGRSITPEQCDQDARLFKKMNCNYIRTSHYPPSEEFLEACDKYGLIVESEAPFCWVNHGANSIWGKWNSLSPELLPYMLYGNLANVVFNRNHPSVLIWSLANESAWSPLWARVNNEVKKLDPTRPTSFHDQCWGGYNNNKSKADIAVYHYPDENGPAQCDKEDRPVLFGEYCHLECYNRRELEADPGIRDDWGRPFDRMVSLMQKHKGCLGGAIWSGIDDTFRLPEGKLVGYGPWGPIDSLRREKPEAWHVKKAYSPVRVVNPHAPLPLSRTITLDVENRFDFTDLSELKVDCWLADHQVEWKASGAPGQIGKLTLTLPKDPEPGQTLHLAFFLQANGQFAIDEENLSFEAKPSDIMPLQVTLPLKVESDLTVLSAASDILQARIDMATGLLTCKNKAGADQLIGGPTLMLLPLNPDSGGGGGNDYRENIEPFNPVCSDWKAGKPTVDQSKPYDIGVTVPGTYAEAQGAYGYRIRYNEIEVSYSFRLLKDVNPRQVGVVFYLPKAAFTRLYWQGRGYWTAYPSGHIGSPLGSALIEPRPAQGLRSWSEEGNAMGSNLFRSTKNDCVSMTLYNNGREVQFSSPQPQAMRAWIEGDRIAVLVTSFSTGGSDGFFATHYAAERKPLKAGDEVKGTVTIRFNL